MQRNKMLTSGLAVAALLLCWQPGEAGQRKKERNAQQKDADIVMPIRSWQVIEMSKKQRVKCVENATPKIVDVGFEGPGFHQVRVFGAQSGTAKVVLSDEGGNLEAFTISVGPDTECSRCVPDQAAPAATSVAAATPLVTARTPSTPQISSVEDAKEFFKVFEKIVTLAAEEKPADDAQVQELIKILNEAKSPSTLVATAIALLPLGDKAKPAVPALLRNAERLKVLDDIGNPGSKKGEMAAMLMEIVFAIQSGWTPDDDRPSVINQRWGMQPRYPVAPPPSVMPPPYYMPNAPACTPSVCPQLPAAQPQLPMCPSQFCPTSGFNESPFRW